MINIHTVLTKKCCGPEFIIFILTFHSYIFVLFNWSYSLSRFIGITYHDNIFIPFCDIKNIIMDVSLVDC
jgi:hypothetical protein